MYLMNVISPITIVHGSNFYMTFSLMWIWTEPGWDRVVTFMHYVSTQSLVPSACCHVLQRTNTECIWCRACMCLNILRITAEEWWCSLTHHAELCWKNRGHDIYSAGQRVWINSGAMEIWDCMYAGITHTKPLCMHTHTFYVVRPLLLVCIWDHDQ